MTTNTIPQLLSEEEINIIAIGIVIFETTKEYSQRVNDEVISPIATWLDDPDFLKRHKVRIEDDIPNWAEYKREQRNYNILIAQEALRLKREQDRIKKDYLKRIATLIPRSRGSPSDIITTCAIDHVSPIASILSPQTKAKIDLAQKFDHAREISPSLKLPWKHMIESELTESSTLQDLTVIYPEQPKLDTAIKLSYLLQMETEGILTLSQDEPFGEILVTSQNIKPDGSFIITDRKGNTEEITLNDLNDEEQSDLIASIKANELICQSA